MRTTLDLPDALFKKAKVRAVEKGISLKTVVIEALERDFNSSPDLAARRQRAKRLFAALDKARNTKPIGRLDRASLYDR